MEKYPALRYCAEYESDKLCGCDNVSENNLMAQNLQKAELSFRFIQGRKSALF
jgi:hypothetical protein